MECPSNLPLSPFSSSFPYPSPPPSLTLLLLLPSPFSSSLPHPSPPPSLTLLLLPLTLLLLPPSSSASPQQTPSHQDSTGVAFSLSLSSFHSSQQLLGNSAGSIHSHVCMVYDTGFCRTLATCYNLDFQIWKLFQPALVSVINFQIWKSRL